MTQRCKNAPQGLRASPAGARPWRPWTSAADLDGGAGRELSFEPNDRSGDGQVWRNLELGSSTQFRPRLTTSTLA